MTLESTKNLLLEAKNVESFGKKLNKMNDLMKKTTDGYDILANDEDFLEAIIRIAGGWRFPIKHKYLNPFYSEPALEMLERLTFSPLSASKTTQLIFHGYLKDLYHQAFTKNDDLCLAVHKIFRNILNTPEGIKCLQELHFSGCITADSPIDLACFSLRRLYFPMLACFEQEPLKDTRKSYKLEPLYWEMIEICMEILALYSRDNTLVERLPIPLMEMAWRRKDQARLLPFISIIFTSYADLIHDEVDHQYAKRIQQLGWELIQAMCKFPESTAFIQKFYPEVVHEHPEWFPSSSTATWV